jgi:hypothetical protein
VSDENLQLFLQEHEGRLIGYALIDVYRAAIKHGIDPQRAASALMEKELGGPLRVAVEDIGYNKACDFLKELGALP